MTRVIVVGGGLAGLVSARRLAAQGADVQLLERRPEVGGRVRSVHESGYTFDRGFQVLFTAYPAVREELDLDALDLRRFRPGATIAQPGHRSTLADPVRDPRALLQTAFNRDVTWRDKLKIAKLRGELLERERDHILDGGDEPIRAYLERRGFSRRFVENFAAPFYGGITLDRSLSTSSVVFEYTFRTLAEGTIALPAGGMGEIPAQLARRARGAGAEVETGVEVTGVAADADGTTVETAGETLAADAVVVATDPQSARSLTGVEAIPTASRGCVTLYLSAPDRHDLGGDRRLLLNAEDARPNHVAPMSAVAPEYAPDGRRLFAATFLGTPEESDDALAATVRETLSSWFPEYRLDELRLEHTSRIPFAQFDQPPGFRSSLPDVDAPEGPVYLAGDYTRWSSIQGALASGRIAAEAVREDS